VLVHALVGAVGANPEPSILAVFDGFDEELADLVRRGLLVALLGENDGPQLFLVPVCRGFHLLLLLLFSPGIGVQTPLFDLALVLEVVGELALLALFTVALLEEDTDDSLGVDAEWDLLDLGRLVHQSLDIALGILGGLLLLLPLELLGLLALLLRGATRFCHCAKLSNLFLSGTALLVLHAEGLVRDRLLGGRLDLFPLLRRHDGGVVVWEADVYKIDGRHKFGSPRRYGCIFRMLERWVSCPGPSTATFRAGVDDLEGKWNFSVPVW
jgi:hypothetical protein